MPASWVAVAQHDSPLACPVPCPAAPPGTRDSPAAALTCMLLWGAGAAGRLGCVGR